MVLRAELTDKTRATVMIGDVPKPLTVMVTSRKSGSCLSTMPAAKYLGSIGLVEAFLRIRDVGMNNLIPAA